MEFKMYLRTTAPTQAMNRMTINQLSGFGFFISRRPDDRRGSGNILWGEHPM
jgi:hypothetical protein